MVTGNSAGPGSTVKRVERSTRPRLRPGLNIRRGGVSYGQRTHRRPSFGGVLMVLIILVALVMSGYQIFLEVTSAGTGPAIHPPIAPPPPAIPAEVVLLLQRHQIDLDLAHARIDRLIEGVEALSPRIPGRERPPVLVEEAKRMREQRP